MFSTLSRMMTKMLPSSSGLKMALPVVLLEESTQRESGQRQQHAPRGGPGEEAL